MQVSAPFSAPACPPDTGALLEAGEYPVITQRHGAHIVVIANAGEHELGGLRRSPRRIGDTAAVLVDPRIGPGPGPVEDRHGIAGPCEVAGHGVAHHA
jgi:hypothetical protein